MNSTPLRAYRIRKNNRKEKNKYFIKKNATKALRSILIIIHAKGKKNAKAKKKRRYNRIMVLIKAARVSQFIISYDFMNETGNEETRTCDRTENKTHKNGEFNELDDGDGDDEGYYDA